MFAIQMCDTLKFSLSSQESKLFYFIVAFYGDTQNKPFVPDIHWSWNAVSYTIIPSWSYSSNIGTYYTTSSYQ